MNNSQNKYATKPRPILVGETWETINCGNLVITEYKGWKEVVFKFIGYEDTYTAQVSHIRSGTIKNPMLPSIEGIGYIGVGHSSHKKDKKAYQTWKDMIVRCYSEKELKRGPSYVDCYVCEEWLNFQNFAKWFYEESNYEKFLQLDKDIIQQGNKVYTPDVCSFITKDTNALVTMRDSARGKYKLGVYWHTKSSRFLARCSDDGKQIHLGSFRTEDEAHEAYKSAKHIKLRKFALMQTDDRVKQGLLKWVIPEY
jgi:hypothetical protein